MDRTLKCLPRICFWATYLFLYTPIIAIVIFSFGSSEILGQWGGFTLKWYTRLFKNQLIVESLKSSVLVSAVSSILATTMATMFTFTRERLGGGKRAVALEVSLVAILMSPEIIFGVSLLIFFNFIGMALGFTTLILAHTLASLPLAWLVIMARMKSIAREWEEAAMDLGATYLQAIAKITLPLLRPAIVASLLVTFSYSFDCFVVSFFLAGPGQTTLPLRTYSLLRVHPTPEINALSTLLFALPLFFVGIASRLMSSSFKRLGLTP
ncbi:MAG: ABC transporter permease [Elusimicrobiota bacterium]